MHETHNIQIPDPSLRWLSRSQERHRKLNFNKSLKYNSLPRFWEILFYSFLIQFYSTVFLYRNFLIQKFYSTVFLYSFILQFSFSFGSYKPGVPKLQDLMPDDLRWSWYNNNRNKVHNKCNFLESLRNHLPTLNLWKNCLSWNQPLMPKRLGTAVTNHF